MSTALLVILVCGACFGGWAFLSVMAAERQRLLSEAAASRPRPPAPAPSALPKPAAPGPAAKPRAAGESSGDSSGKARQSKAKRASPAVANAR